MTAARLAMLCLALSLTTLARTGEAQQSPQAADVGLREYLANCARCHETNGKGDGHYAQFHKIRIPDLTQLSARNNGVFPAERVREIIDGTRVVILHGTPGMAVWGDKYKAMAAEDCKAKPCDSAAFIDARILALTDYIRTLNSR